MNFGVLCAQNLKGGSSKGKPALIVAAPALPSNAHKVSLPGVAFRFAAARRCYKPIKQVQLQNVITQERLVALLLGSLFLVLPSKDLGHGIQSVICN